ncbi:MAG: putative MerR-family transcriptional regulator [Frankiales bacterium]|nr:putative MerR-family transcriptional regulator [Frankiales bacterium]
MTDLTVDQLAAEVGMTVRNVRAYAARGLLPPPRLVGRTGYYNSDHVGRLKLVRQMLSEGYTLTAVTKALAGSAPSAGDATLALHQSLLTPFQPEQPEETTAGALAARAGSPVETGLLDVLADMGVIELLEEDRVRVLDPALVAAGLQVMRLGISPNVVIHAQRQVIELVEQAAEVYVTMFRSSIWADFVARGMPEAEWASVQEAVERLQPLAAQALLASFRTAMADAAARAVEAEAAALG